MWNFLKKLIPSNDFVIPLEDLSKEPGLRWRGLFAGAKQRFATVTSVKFINQNLLVCASLLGRKMYLIDVNIEDGSYNILDKITTTFNGQTVETDLLDTDQNGNIYTCNCAAGSITQYKISDNKLVHVRDLPTGYTGFIHGLKLFSPDIICAAFIGGPLGIHFFKLDTMEDLLHIKTDIKAKDLCFVSENELAIATMHGQVTGKKSHSYDSEIQLVKFDLKNRTYDVYKKKMFYDSHFDCIVYRDEKLYLNEQFKGNVLVIDRNSLEKIGQIRGFDFPHGLDINDNKIAVSNYGNNTIKIQSI